MLIAITLWLIRKYRITGISKKFITRLHRSFRIPSINKAGVLFIYLLPATLQAQEQKRTYEVIRNGSVIGHLSFRQRNLGCSTHLRVESEVTARFIFLMTLWAKEETIYRNGILVFSSVYRKLNGKEKTNIETKLAGDTYQINNKGSMASFKSYPIRFNLLNMYGTEPKQITEAYADNFRKFVPVEKTGISQYKVTLPDGNYNYYFYKDGICTRVEVYHSLYSLKFNLIR